MPRDSWNMPVSSRVSEDTFDEINDIIDEDNDMRNMSDFIRIAIEFYLDGRGHISNKTTLGRIFKR